MTRLTLGPRLRRHHLNHGKVAVRSFFPVSKIRAAAMVVLICILPNFASAEGVSFDHQPLIPGQNVGVSVEGVTYHMCQGAVPIKVEILNQTVHFIGRGVGCSFNLGIEPYIYTVDELMIPVSSDMVSGVVEFDRSLLPGSEPSIGPDEAVVELPSDITQFVYFAGAGGDLHVFRTDAWHEHKRLSAEDPIIRVIADPGHMIFPVMDSGSYVSTRWFDPNLNTMREDYRLAGFTDVIDSDDGFYYRAAAYGQLLASDLGGGLAIASLSGDGFALAKSPQFIYVSLQDQSGLAVIQRATEFTSPVEVGSVAVGPNPRALHQSRDQSRLIVSNSGDGSVSLVDTSSDTVVSTVAVGTEINQFVHVQSIGRFYGLGLDNQVYAFDDQTGAVVDSRGFNASIDAIAANESTGELYVLFQVSADRSSLLILAADTLETLDYVPLSFLAVHMAAYASVDYWVEGKVRGATPVPIPGLNPLGMAILVVLCIALVQRRASISSGVRS